MEPSHDKLYQLLTKLSEDIGHLKGTSEATLAQAKLTNGRLTRAEGEIKTLNNFKTKVKTYGTVGGAILAFITSSIGVLF